MDDAKLLECRHRADAESSGTEPQMAGSTRDVWIFTQGRHGWIWQRIVQESDVVVASQNAFLMFDDCIKDAQRNGYVRWAV